MQSIEECINFQEEQADSGFKDSILHYLKLIKEHTSSDKNSNFVVSMDLERYKSLLKLIEIVNKIKL